MPRLPFDPAKMAASSRPGPKADSGAETSKVAPLTVSQLAAMIDGTLRDHLPARLRVVGELSGFNDRTHWYFSLKDAESVVSCVMFASAAREARFRPEAGQEVVVTGRVEYFGKQGRTQFYVDRIEPVGAGALDLEFRRLCEELRALGWFLPERKRPLPRFPRCVAVVTSRTGAALQDVLNTMARRCPAVGVLLADVRVQGDGAAAGITAAVRAIGRRHGALGVDAIIVTRGGGSKEDLWAFNDHALAQAIVESPVPVVAAIGHETDTTIAELVADERCATPTQAAMRVTPDSAALLEQLDALGSRLAAFLRKQIRQDQLRLGSATRHPFFSDPGTAIKARTEILRHHARRLTGESRGRLTAAAHALERLAVRLEAHRPGAVYARRQAGLLHAEARLRAAMRTMLARIDLDDRRQRLTTTWAGAAQRRTLELDGAERALDLVGPVSVLRRGYSCTLKPDGSAVRSVGDIHAGDPIKTIVSDGSFESTVGTSRPGAPAIPPAAFRRPPVGRRARKDRSGSRDQMDLFGRPE
jgi:exodeoxyribonuclease VII large subunit